MAKSAASRSRPDPLKASLDALAKQLVEKATQDPDATVRTLSDALKVAGGYYHQSRGGKVVEDEAPESAWADYTKSFTATKAGENGKAH